MFTKYASIWALASTAFAAPLACDADSPLVTVTTYVTGLPPTSSSTSISMSTSTSTSLPAGFIGYEADNTSEAAALAQPTVSTPSTFATVATSVTSVKLPQIPTYVPSAPAPSSSAPAVVPVPSNATSPSPGKSGAVWITPHEQYSSSVGVLGCKINHNRVAYWPLYPDVNRYCVKVTRKGRSLHLLHIDQSGGANDISYDAWNYLATGKSAKDAPHCGGALEAQFEWVDNKECADLILSGDGRLPLAASNPDLAPYAPEPKEKYVKLYNLKDMQCQIGKDEECKLPNYALGYNLAVCPSGLGNVNDPSGIVFEDIKYDTARAGGCPQLSPTD